MNKKVIRKYFKDDYLLTGIGTKLREYRTAQGLSIENLAIKCEVPYSQLSRIELGKVNFSVSFLSKIAAALEIDPKDLLP